VTSAPAVDDQFVAEVIRSTAEPILAVDSEGQVVFANLAVRRVLGYDPTELIDASFEHLCPEDGLSPLESTYERFDEEATGPTDRIETTLRHADGSDVAVSVGVEVTEYRQHHYATLTIHEAADHLVNRAASEGDMRYRDAFDYSNDAMLIFDPDEDVFTQVNDRACDLLGYSRDELLSLGPSDIHPHELDTFHGFVAEVREEGDGWTDDLSCHTASEDVIPVEVSMSLLEFDDRPHVLASVRDVSERKRRERELQRERDRLSALFENASDPIVEVELADGAIIRGVNAAFERVFGFDAEQVCDRPIRDVLVPGQETDRITHEEIVRGVFEDEENVELTVTRQTVDGPRDFLLRAVPISVHDDEPEAYGIYTDITEQREHARRLQALNEASRRMLVAETEDDVAAIAVEIVENILDRSLSSVWRYDATDDLLHELAGSEEARSLVADEAESLSPIRAGTAEMEAFREGETRLLEDYGAEETAAHQETPLDARLVEPLGEHGLLAVGATTADNLDAGVRDLIGVVARSAEAALDRLERERLARLRSVAMDAATDGMAILDEEKRYVYVNDAYGAMHGYDDGDELLDGSWERLYGDDTIDRLRQNVLPSVREDGHWRGETVGTRADGTTFPQELTLTRLDGSRLICVVRDVTERRERKRQLEALNDVARDLMRTDDREAIAEIGADAAEQVLSFPVACVRLFDHETNQLEIAALTDDAEALLASRAAYDMEATHAGRALRGEETVVNEVSVDAGTERASLHTPIGAYGTLSVVADAGAAFDEHDIQLAELLAMTVEAAIAQAEQNRLLRERTDELRQQRDQLETLNELNSLIQEIGTQLGEAVTREDLERSICEQLTVSDLFQGAWIGGVDETHDRVSLHASAGIDEAHAEAIDRMPLSMLGDGAVQLAVETGDVEVVRQYQVAGSAADARERVEEFESVAAIPFGYGERIYCVLVVTSDREDVFSENALAGFKALGKMGGFAINATRNRELLLSDEVVELKFEVSDPDVFYVRMTDELDCRCRFERAVPFEGEKVVNYHHIEGADADRVLELADDADWIERAEIGRELEEGFVLQTTATRSTVHLAMETGATLRSASAENGTATLLFEAPTGSVRAVARTLRSTFADVDLVAKRELERSVRTSDDFRDAIDAQLTEKQRAALESAHAAGYYEWPRAITAEDLAETLDVSSSTLHQHLRRGEHKLLSTFFDDDEHHTSG